MTVYQPNQSLIKLARFLILDMVKWKVEFIYNGPVTQKSVIVLSQNAEEKIKILTDNISRQKSMFHCMVELLQNISKHSINRDPSDIYSGGNGMIILLEEESSFLLLAGNETDKKDYENLKGKVKHINSLNEEELRAFHKVQLKKPGLSERGGAGIGLIDLKRKSGNSIGLKNFHNDENLHFMVISVRFNKLQ